AREAAGDAVQVAAERLRAGMADGAARLDEDRLAAPGVARRPVEPGQALAPAGHVHAVGPLQARLQLRVGLREPLGPALAVAAHLLLAGDALQVLADALAECVA